MKAAFLLRPGRIVCSEVAQPRPERGDLVVRVHAALTCGTDLKAFQRGHPKMPMPTPFGHEFSGEVAEIGPGVNGFRQGDEVMVVHTAPCRTCYYCRRQQENLCTTLMETMILGAYAEYIRVPAPIVEINIYRKPRHLSFAEAALLEPLSCVVHSLEMVPFEPEDAVVIIGAGGFALLHLLVLRTRGVEKIVVVGRRAYRREAARQLGAWEVMTDDPEGVRERVLHLTHGRGADTVIECTGQPSVWERTVDLARPGGQVILFGGCPPATRVGFSAHRLHYDQIALYSPFHFTPRSVRQAYDLLVEGKIPSRFLISGTFSLDQIAEVFGCLQRGEGVKYALAP